MKIKNKQLYFSRMEKPLQDKLFFLDKIKVPQQITDFGCANGVLTCEIAEYFGRHTWVWGYDIDTNQIHKNHSDNENHWNVPRITFTDKLPNHYDTIILSSVIHEVLSYCNWWQQREFWNYVFKHKQIVIRDMIPSASIDREPHMNDIRRLYIWLLFTKSHRMYSDFVKYHGVASKSQRNLVHFLLKYRYIDNWDREVRESYMPITLEQLLKKIPKRYNIIYKNHYILPFVKDTIKQDFNIDLNDNTHLQMILMKDEVD